MKNKLTIFALASLLLPFAVSAANVNCDASFGYCLNSSSSFNWGEWIANWSDPSGKVTNYSMGNNLKISDPNHQMLHVYHYQGDDVACNTSKIGNAEMYFQEKDGKDFGATMWGKMSLLPAGDNFINTYCVPSTDGCTQEEVYEGTCETDAATYAFCSQNGDKIVAICLYQNQDNPDMAAEIFNSFEWQETTAFSDVPTSYTYADAISYVRDENIVSGYPDGTYKPDNSINRAEFTKIVVNAALDASLLTKNQECFPDVTTTDWFAPFVCTAKEQGIISGYPDGTFKAAGNINAAEAFKIVAEAFGMALPQAGEKDAWYQRYWAAMQEHSAIPATVTAPDQLLTRGEMAAVIYSVMNSNER